MGSTFSLSRREFGTALAIVATGWPAAARETGMVPEMAIRELGQKYLAAGKIPNIVVAIGRRGTAPVFTSLGQQDLGSGPAVGPDTLYRIYSMTKPVTGIAIMMLVEDGKLSIDTPVAEIFPPYGQARVLVDPASGLETRPVATPMLVRHLLTHSSGFGYASNVPDALKSLYQAGGGETARASAEEESRRPADLIAFAEKVAELPLLFEPGTSWHYGISLDIAGAVVERVSGQPFEVFLRQRLFEPLGMGDTAFTVPKDKLSRLVSNYNGSPNGLDLLESGLQSLWARPPRFPVGGSGLVSSARDYARFMAMLLGEGEVDGLRVMATETARLAMSDMMAPGVMQDANAGHSGYGAGGRVVVEATGDGEAPGTFGWSGAASTYAFVDRTSDLYFVLMTQVMGVFPQPLHVEATRLLYGTRQEV